MIPPELEAALAEFSATWDRREDGALFDGFRAMRKVVTEYRRWKKENANAEAQVPSDADQSGD